MGYRSDLASTCYLSFNNASTSSTHVEPFIVSSQATSPCIVPCLFHQPLLTLSLTIPFNISRFRHVFNVFKLFTYHQPQTISSTSDHVRLNGFVWL
ncbi:hypothetical protein M422DRAFT_781278, partial [Sphaerobolus stellatus SS14]